MSTTEKIDWSKCDDVESVPGRVSGAWVIKGTRVQADAIVENARAGCTAEEIAGPDIPRASPSTSSSACCASPRSHRPRTDEDPARRKRSKRFAPHTRHDVRTAPEMGWARYSNGQLLDEAEKAGFEALIKGIEACRISRISPAEISPSSFSPPMPGPSFAPSHRRCSARSRMSHPALSPLPPFTVRDDPGARLHPRAEFSPASTDKFLDAAKISAAMNRAGCRASVSVPTCSSPHHLSSISAVTCARYSEFPRHEFRVTGGLAPSHHCRRRDPQCHDSDQMRILSSLRPRHRSAVPY